MILHKDATFKDAIQATSQKLGIKYFYIEKDYWVTLALFNLSNSKIADKIVFKGGTSLSKAHHVIKRFSEDIDIALIPQDGRPKTQTTKKSKRNNKHCRSRSSRRYRKIKKIFYYKKSLLYISKNKNTGRMGTNLTKSFGRSQCLCHSFTLLQYPNCIIHLSIS